MVGLKAHPDPNRANGNFQIITAAGERSAKNAGGITLRKRSPEGSQTCNPGPGLPPEYASILDRMKNAFPGSLNFPGQLELRLVLHDRQYHSPHFDPRRISVTLPLGQESQNLGRLDLYLGLDSISFNNNPFRDQILTAMQTAAGELAENHLQMQIRTRPDNPEVIYRLALTSISDSVLMTDSEGVFTFICAAGEKIFGYSYAEVFDMYRIQNLLGADPYESVNNNNRREFNNIEHTVIDKDGQQCTVLINIKKILSEPPSCLYTCHDISKLRAAEKAQFQLASIVESSYDAIIGMDLEGSIVSWNNGAREIYGYEVGEILGKPIQILIPPEKSEEIGQVLKKIKNCGRLNQYETIRMTRDGSRFDASVTLSPIRDRHKNIIGISAIVKDISLQRKAEREMQDACEKLETERTVLKEIMSHIEEDKRKIEVRIQANYDRIILPLLQSLREKSRPEDDGLLKLLESGLNDITSPFINTLDSNFARLSPRELSICNMIKNGLSSKEISVMLNISILTVHKFRQQIRKKLGLANKSINLTSFLKTIS